MLMRLVGATGTYIPDARVVVEDWSIAANQLLLSIPHNDVGPVFYEFDDELITRMKEEPNALVKFTGPMEGTFRRVPWRRLKR